MEKIKILFIAANPEETSKLNLDEEIRSISQKIRSADHRDSLELISIWATRPDDLLQYLNEHKPQIVHFSGHGNKSGEIILLGDDRRPKPVSTEALKALFSVLKDNIQLIILNACYTKPIADVIANTVGCVIGMNTSIGDKAAIVYAASFYRAIGFGRSLKEAFEQGKAALLLEGIREEKTPELIVRKDITPSKIYLINQNKEQKKIAEKWLSKTQGYLNEAKYEDAANCAENFAEWAKEVDDTEMERKAHISAARSLDYYIVTTRPEPTKHNHTINRMRQHIDAAENLEEPASSIYLLRAQLARLEHKPADVIHFAQKAEEISEGFNAKAEALVALMQAYWQMEQPKEILEYENKVKILIQKLENVDNKLILQGTWLRSICKAGKATEKDVINFIEAVKNEQEHEEFTAAHVLQLVGEVASDFSQSNDLENCLALLNLANDLCEIIDEPGKATHVNLQISELYAELGNVRKANEFIDKANVSLDKLKTKLQGQTKEKWANLKAISLFTHGRVYKRLFDRCQDIEDSLKFLLLSNNALSEALKFIDEKNEYVTGNVSEFLMEIKWWRGRSNVELGKLKDAITDFRESRPEVIPSKHPLKGRWLKLWQLEAEALMLNGQLKDALSVTEDILNATVYDEQAQNRAKSLYNYIKKRLLPVSDWLSGNESKEISRQVTLDGLMNIIAKQSEPLVVWWNEFQSDDGRQANSEMFDIWGRGAFSRIIAAIRVQPSNAIMVDPTTIDEIKLWSRIFCPFYDTVIVKWKGPLQEALAMIPMPDFIGPRGTFGGQGYMRTNSEIEKEGYHVAVGWANMMPIEVSTFLATEAMPLIKSGRLVVLPASLIGCTQSNVGWTDNMLVDGHMQGVATVVQKSSKYRELNQKTDSTIINLADLSIPFIDNIPLGNLNTVLEDTAEWLKPMRKMLKSTLGSSVLRDENWEPLNPIFDDLREASRKYKEQLLSLKMKSSGQNWHINETVSTISVASSGNIKIGSDSVTDMLRSIATSRPELGHWIPYWRLNEAGGQVNWTGALDNRSKEPDPSAKNSLAMMGAETLSPQSWWYPGSGGPGMGASFRLA